MSRRWFRRTVLQVVAAVFLLVVGACGGSDVTERAGIADTATASESASPEPGLTTTTTTTTTTQEAAGQLPPMRGLCAQFPVRLAVEVFDEAAIELTTGVEAEEACEIEVRDNDNRLLASFVLGAITNAAPGGYQRSQDGLFDNNALVAETVTGAEEPFREPIAIGEEAELIRGFVTQLAISDGTTIWLVRLQLDSPPMDTDVFTELGQILYDNQPEF